MSTEVEVNPYELLNVELEADERTIRTAYRQRSLKVHPDRVRAVVQSIQYLTDRRPQQNPNNPDAGTSFSSPTDNYN